MPDPCAGGCRKHGCSLCCRYCRFAAVIGVLLQYIKRKRTAEAMRHAYEERLQQSAEGGAAVDGEHVAAGQHAGV